VLPLGTLNHFAKDLKIPLEVEEAARNICEGHAVLVDVGEVNGRVFINNSSLGLYPHIVRQQREASGARVGAASGRRYCARRSRCCAAILS
jgi:diacylglycerol kinase family enzyme